ncbi:MAG: hypothetical protein IJV05_04510 [Muribaculaceae bacterium]|nr:hypothetical protein [Muribaculaceae bacterium]
MKGLDFSGWQAEWPANSPRTTMNLYHQKIGHKWLTLKKHNISLQRETQSIIMGKAIKYKNREEAVAALRKMIERKRIWIEQTEQEFAQLRQQTLQ